MPVLKPTAEWGRCIPPESNYGITTYAPGWQSAVQLREGDPAIMARIVHIYPRFGPFGPVSKALMAICEKMRTPEGHGALYWTSPVAYDIVRAHATHLNRKEHVVAETDLGYRCADVGGVRLYLVTYPMPKTPGVIGAWQNPGTGVSIRLAEHLLANIDSLKEVEVPAGGLPAPPTEYLPENESHAKLRRRIVGLLHRAAVDPEKVKVQEKDVFLYMTGMAGIFECHRTLLAHRPGAVAILGIAFHSTIHYIQDSSPHGYRHFGPVNSEGLDVFEAWLDELAADGKSVSYVITEFPNNPLLASTDLIRLKKLSEKHNFVFIVDDTVGSFANIDVLASSDILLTSLTKSFSGYANVMGGSVALNPLSPHYAALSHLWAHTFHNEFYVADADVLLSNSEDYLARTAILNRNAAAMAAHLLRETTDPASPVTKILYPPHLPDYANYTPFLRCTSDELPEPGAGCLLTIDFDSVASARAFYDRLAFYPGPHLGAHRTLSFCYATLAFGKDKDEAAYHRSYGLLEESVRLSAGLEDVQDLLDTLDDALAVARAAKAAGSGVAS